MASQGRCENCAANAVVCQAGYCRECHQTEGYSFEVCDTRTDLAWFELACSASREDIAARYPGALLDEPPCGYVLEICNAIVRARAKFHV